MIIRGDKISAFPHAYPTHGVIGFSPIGEFVLSNLFVYPLEMEPFHII